MGAPGTISVAIATSEASIPMRIEKDHLELLLLVLVLRERGTREGARAPA